MTPGRRRDDERGTVVVLFAVSVVAMLTLAALVLDGGSAYALRRQTQNAADAAAMAGTRVLDRARFAGGPAAAVQAEVQAAASRNGADGAACEVVDARGAGLGPCTAPYVTASGAVGVRVEARTSRPAFFGGIAGRYANEARAGATATTQTLVGGDSPFMVCSGQQRAGKKGTDGGDLPALLSSTAPPVVNPAAVGQTYEIHGPQVPDCGAGSSFKGLADPSPDGFVLPAWLDAGTGVKAGPTRSALAGGRGCTGSAFDGCVLLVPICVDGRGSGSKARLYCVAFGAFRMNSTGKNEHSGTLLGNVMATGGRTSTDRPSAAAVRVVKLLA